MNPVHLPDTFSEKTLAPSFVSTGATVTSTIGEGLRDRRLGVAIAVAIVAAELEVVRARPIWFSDGRWALALSGLLAIVALSRGNLTTIGLRPPAGGWGRWARLGVYLGLLVGTVSAAVVTFWQWSGHPFPPVPTRWMSLQVQFLHMCVFSPLLEETLYRVVLCVPLAAYSRALAIAVSGLSFATLHVVYGNPSPENLLGGFLLAWAYLRSGSLAVPLLLHSAGNLIVLIFQVWAASWT